MNVNIPHYFFFHSLGLATPLQAFLGETAYAICEKNNFYNNCQNN